MYKNRKASVLRMTELAILTAIVVLLQCFGGFLKLNVLGAEANFVLIPIAIGAILLGPLAGAWLGFIDGVIVLLFGITGAVPFTNLLFLAHPLLTTLICIVKTTAAGLVAGLVYRALAKWNEHLSVFLASVLVPIVNTGLFILGSFTVLDSLELMAGSQNVLVFLFTVIIGINFFLEFGLNLILAPAIERIISLIRKQLHGKK